MSRATDKQEAEDGVSMISLRNPQFLRSEIAPTRISPRCTIGVVGLVKNHSKEVMFVCPDAQSKGEVK